MYDISHFTKKDYDKFWSKVFKVPKSECLQWVGTFQRAAPMFYTGTQKEGNRNSYQAARRAFQLHGLVPPRYLVRSCETLGCCNPAHNTKAPFVYSATSREVSIVAGAKRRYTRRQRSKPSLGTEVDAFLSTLQPLKNGKSVSLSMDNPMFTSRAKYRGAKAKVLVILVPGALAGIDPEAVMVSLIGLGACIVRPAVVSKNADLVLAGMPARLAVVLMEKLHRLFKEK